MKILKVILGIVIALAVAVGVLSFVVPTEMTVERSIVINAPKERVFDYLRHTANEKEWSPWWKMDPNMSIVTQGVDGEVGYKYSWEGNRDVGAGEMEIKSIELDRRIDSELRFKKPMEGTANAWFITEETGMNQTNVRWGLHSVSKRPFNAICLIINTATDMMNKMFDQGLNDLKLALESVPAKGENGETPAEPIAIQ